MRNNCLLVGVSIKLLHIKKLKKMELVLNRKYTAISITPYPDWGRVGIVTSS